MLLHNTNESEQTVLRMNNVKECDTIIMKWYRTICIFAYEQYSIKSERIEVWVLEKFVFVLNKEIMKICIL